MEVIITIVVLLLLLLAVIWGHYLRTNINAPSTAKSVRDETNVRLYHEHKAEIEKDYAEGGIDQENYQYLLAELDKSLLQDIEENAGEPKLAADKPLSVVWPMVLTVFVLAFSFALYLKNGAYEQLSQPAMSAANQGHEGLSNEQQMMVRLKQLQQLTEQEPQNSQAWYNLGQAAIGLGDFDGALAAFDQVMAIEGEHADILGAKAQAMFYQNGQQINEAIQALIDKALALDPNDPSTNILLGLNHFIGQNYGDAIAYWQKVVDLGGNNVNTQALQGAINEAKSRMAAAGQPVPEAAVSGSQLVLNVDLTDDIRQQLSQGEDKTVFVYAIPANGPRMPLAAVKIRASDLPTTVVLNDSQAMNPQMTLSSVESVNLYAVVSNLGSVGIKPGDYTGELKDISVASSDAIELTINTLVPES
ncbi:c-type cytochrome biogenesis protein CcmI [Thalassomonas viridans]|uniref:C-type cytochrome biogenesis protein CcmI n=1 Tax=Thalassomonas viridans TaxID=137584 RepID=A0AAE9Z4D7_9GAMM|nr:c-type cytochrome biogenesis protein CcmI [Thalassomonas viridans]WDE05814.1 c-type cytochrome biogenesis protein CcmI [Thalassomonas viridans]